MESLLQLFRSISIMMSSVSELTVRVKVGPGAGPGPAHDRLLQAGLPRPSPSSHARMRWWPTIWGRGGGWPCASSVGALTPAVALSCAWKDRLSVHFMYIRGSWGEKCCRGISMSEQVWEAVPSGPRASARPQSGQQAMPWLPALARLCLGEQVPQCALTPDLLTTCAYLSLPCCLHLQWGLSSSRSPFVWGCQEARCAGPGPACMLSATLFWRFLWG